jgi:hypothetical protein
MHPTADTTAVIFGTGAARRVMRALCGGLAEGMNGTSVPGGGDVLAPRSGFGESWTPHNKRMHATADTQLVINLCWAGRRVMRGVRRLRKEYHEKS